MTTKTKNSILFLTLNILFFSCTPVIKESPQDKTDKKIKETPIEIVNQKPKNNIINKVEKLKVKDEKIVRIGLMENYPQVVFNWVGLCTIEGGDGTIISDSKKSSVTWKAQISGKGILLTNQNSSEKFFYNQKIKIKPHSEDAFIELSAIKEGKGWHWEKSKSRRYRGAIEFVVQNGSITVVNEVALNHYLYGVVPSEMPHQAPLEALKAQAVLARTNTYSTMSSKYKNKPYELFSDVFSQVYGGLNNERESSNQAVDATAGLILTCNDQPVEAMFFSMCGGHTEASDWVWSGKPVNYLLPKPCSFDDDRFENLDSEDNFRKYIDNPPNSFCNMSNRQFPPAFDYAKKYFRWEKNYSRVELEKIINKNITQVLGKKINFGSLKNIIVTLRGKSGKIRTIKVVGTKNSFEVTKELSVRRLLGSSPLYSANFYITTTDQKGGLPTNFQLKGTGFGHSVGMCQVGAAGMATDGYHFQDILEFYFPSSIIKNADY